MLNLINDPWIPVQRIGGPDVIRPYQIAEPDVLFPNWPRPDLNLACLELLVGLVYISSPPENADEWISREANSKALNDALKPLAPAFNLLGDGPRFMQDIEKIESKENPLDMLFIDSAGKQTQSRNSDLMVKRSRYNSISLPLAAMALYTLQAFAPAGGAGNRTSMRGGGPMVTLVKPNQLGLWPLIWANVPCGYPLENELNELPWMRPTITSEKGQVVTPPEQFGDENPSPEVFFGMPRRLRLKANGDRLVSVRQVPWGTNYEGWIHPLTPYYQKNIERLPKHPKPGTFGYRNWRGILLQTENSNIPGCLDRWRREQPLCKARLVVGGWAMSNMSPLDFLWSEQPIFPLDSGGENRAARLVEAAEQASYLLAKGVQECKGESEITSGVANRVREVFFVQTQPQFENSVQKIIEGEEHLEHDWLAILRKTALSIFDAEVMPGLVDLQESRRSKVVLERRNLLSNFRGYGTTGKKIYTALEFELPKRIR
ncbi:MAG: type I-E CRISPR-associated protein Cse1/CasA [Gammaproteobacteria bacterium]|nr:type I-E CRISPR-associated protein Cse1/CasA [Gammaproteobacteria bacterium]